MSFIDTLVDLDQTEIAEIRIDPATGYRTLFAKKFFEANELIIKFMAKTVQATPSYLTVQVSEHEHIVLFPEFLECANHSCDPNCFFDTTSMEFVTLKPIAEGEELTFFYPSAEWDMDQPFPCNCGTEACISVIQGAKYLSAEVVKKYRFTDFIQGKLGLK
jgi:SET domain